MAEQHNRLQLHPICKYRSCSKFVAHFHFQISCNMNSHVIWLRFKHVFLHSRSAVSADSAIHAVGYTGWSKKTVPQFYFCDNVRKCTPILTICSLLEPDIYDT